MREEIKVMHSLLEKISDKFPNITGFALGDFEEEFGMSAEESNQYFFGWLFCDYALYDGKSIISFTEESFKLNKEEEKFIDNVKNAVIGYFEIISQSNNEVIVKDLLTKKEYSVAVIDLDYMFKKKDVIEARLVKNFDDDLFFFGGFMLKTEEREEIMENLKLYGGLGDEL